VLWQESRSVSPRLQAPVECASNAASVAAVDHSPGTNRTGSAVPVPCSPSNELVIVAPAADGTSQRDEDIPYRLDQVVFPRFLRATAGTAIARLSHRNSVRPSVRLSVCHTGGSGKNGAS